MLTYTFSFPYLKQKIVGSRFTPKTSLQHPVLLVHGFGSNRRGVGRSFISLARKLYENEFEVFTFDRIGHGESDGLFENVSVNDEINQLNAMVDYVLSKYNQKVHIIGHSLGGMESAKLAAERSEVVASLTLWAPGAVFAFEIAEKGIIQGKSIKEVEKTGYFDFKGQKLGLNFIEEAKHFQPYDGLESYKNPAFIHQGEMDDVVAMKYAERYKQCWEQNAKLYTYPYADHGWNNLEARETLIDRTVSDLFSL